MAMGDEPDGSILDALAAHGPATGPELAQLLGTHPITVERRCCDLQQRGRVQQTTGGAYVLAERSYASRPVASD
jgi:DNA-binding IclR family transcriptional regulator